MAALSIKKELIALSDWVWQRTQRRLQGLSDHEYFWEPYPGCWTVRQLPDGTWRTDWASPPPVTPPLTTIAWRIVHLAGCYGSARNSTYLAVELDLAPIESWAVSPSCAAEAVATLGQAQARWSALLTAVDDRALKEALGDVAGQYAKETRTAFVMHQLDEVIHHGAELGVMRDLYGAAFGSVHADPTVAALMCGDLSAFEGQLARRDLMSELAAMGRFDLVEAGLDCGLDPDGPAPTALHRAAALGLNPLVERLLAAGADPSLRDPQFRGTPAQWAEFYGHLELARRLGLGVTG